MPFLQLVLFLLLALSTSAAADTFEGTCQIRFFGDSTLHSFEGRGDCQPFSLADEQVGAAPQIAASEIEVQVAGLDTDNSSRDKKMREMFDSENFPLIIARFRELDSEELLASWQSFPQGELAFDLSIRGLIRPVTATVRNLTVSEQSIDLTLEFTLSLENFALEAPGVLGIIRVDDLVKVEVDTQLKRTSQGPVAAEAQ